MLSAELIRVHLDGSFGIPADVGSPLFSMVCSVAWPLPREGEVRRTHSEHNGLLKEIEKGFILKAVDQELKTHCLG
jgi:hypothetical protein